jgi:ankyrin repeat protein
MFSRTSRTDTITCNGIIYNIITNKVKDLERHINEANINNVIDNKNGYTALHYALRTGNEDIIQYLLNMGADPYIKTSDNQDAFDLCLKYNTKYVIKYKIDELKELNADLNKNLVSTQSKLTEMTKNNRYMIKAFDELSMKYSKVDSENEKLKDEVISLREDNESLNTNMNSLKRKYSNLEKSYSGLLMTIRK